MNHSKTERSSPLRGNKLLRSVIIFTICLASYNIKGQEKTDSLQNLYAELDSLFAEECIPDLFKLADSLLALDSAKVYTLSFRTGYVSKIVTSGRTFGFNQFGITPGLTFYHPNGMFAGVNGYWSSEFSPQYYLTDLSIGYMREIKKKWMINVAHDFYLYNDTLESHYFNKSAEASVYYQTRFSDAGIEYSFLYGDETAHRLTANVSGRLKIKTKGIINSITVMPGAAFQWGNANVYYLRQPRMGASELYQIVKSNNYPRLTLREYARLTSLLEREREIAARLFLRNREYSDSQINTMIDSYYDGQIKQDNVFGFMNYSFSLPVIMNAGRFSLLLNYTYNIPVALPGEEYEYEPNGYFSASLSYLIHWIN